MTVNPGFGGQLFIPHSIDRLRAPPDLTEAKSKAHSKSTAESAVTPSNKCGARADTFVAGNAFFRRRIRRRDQGAP